MTTPTQNVQPSDIVLADIAIPDFGIPDALPAIPAEIYAARADRLVAEAGKDWVVVYADREHVANMVFLTGFEPRFEEALLLLGRKGERILVVGNESHDYAPVAQLPGMSVKLAQSLSLMAQDRTRFPSLQAVLAEAGLANGQTIAIVGWKYLEPDEMPALAQAFVVPHSLVVMLESLSGDVSRLSDATALMMHPTRGLRSVVGADQIAVHEWAAARASAAVWRIVAGARAGMSEFEAAGLMGYEGEPLSCHMMMSGSDGAGAIIGLKSPSAAKLRDGQAVTTAVGYWGALSSRAAMLSGAAAAPGYLDKVKTYYAALLTWYECVQIGAKGGDIHAAVVQVLARSDLRPALNPGHLLSYDEWSHSPIRPGSEEQIASGMVFQVDIIPTPMPAGQALNCEDAVAIADDALRAELAARYPQAFARIEARRRFIAEQLGVTLHPHILPLSNTPLCLAPDWSAAGTILAVRQG